MRARRVLSWVLLRAAWVVLVPVLVVLTVFAFVMAALTEGPGWLAWAVAAPDWRRVGRRCRRCAHVMWAGWSS